MYCTKYISTNQPDVHTHHIRRERQDAVFTTELVVDYLNACNLIVCGIASGPEKMFFFLTFVVASQGGLSFK